MSLLSKGLMDVSSHAQVNQVLKCLQPHREQPSKDRSKRFAAGDLPGDRIPHEQHNVRDIDYWLIMPSVSLHGKAKCFLLVQVLFMTALRRIYNMTLAECSVLRKVANDNYCK